MKATSVPALQRIAHHQPAAHPQHQCGSKRAHEIHAREKDGGQPAGMRVGIEEGAIQIVEMGEVARLAVETLGDADALDRFVQIAVDQRQARPCGAVGLAHVGRQ